MSKKADKVFGPGVPSSCKNYAIGIDQSYSGFGITIMDVKTGGFATTVFKAEGTGIERLNHVYDRLGEIIDRHVTFDVKSQITVAMEGYAFGSQMANMAGELGAIVKWFCWQEFESYAGRYPYIIPPTVLKKYVTGKGTGVQKNQMLLHVFKKWGIEFNDDNAADSYALAHLVAGKCDLTYEREIYHNIQDPKYREK
jgi:crossover junction endodeoxyribonuclease RuvC